MRYRLLFTLLVLMISTAGCSSTPFRPFKWWRSRASGSQVAQTLEPIDHESSIETLSASPPKLPPGIELPPAPKTQSQTQPSGVTQPPESSSKGVIFAGALGTP